MEPATGGDERGGIAELWRDDGTADCDGHGICVRVAGAGGRRWRRRRRWCRRLSLQATVPVGTGATTVAVDVVNPNPGSATSTVANAQVQTSLQSAARLLDQATFGPTLTDIQTCADGGIAGLSGEQFATADDAGAGYYDASADAMRDQHDSLPAGGVVAGGADRARPVAAAGGVRYERDVCDLDQLGQCAGGDRRTRTCWRTMRSATSTP